MREKFAKLRVGEQVALNLRGGFGCVEGRLNHLSADEGKLEIGGRICYLTDFAESLRLEPTSDDLYLVVRRMLK